jgi:hypothetical protein
MDASDIVRQLRDKVVYTDLYPQVSTAKVVTTRTTYTFPDYETKTEYYNAQQLSSMSTCVMTG